jgi:cytochrome c oxidase subunit 4
MSSEASHTGLYIKTYLLLLVLLLATVGAAFINLSYLNIVVALAIASYKGWLVAMNFMHLNESQKLSRIVAFGTFIWLFILIGGLLGDYLTRVPNV